MKYIIALMGVLFFASAQIQTASAQQEDSRIKIILSVDYQGKTVNTQLNSVSTSISRLTDEPTVSVPTQAKDSTANKANVVLSGYKPGAFYLVLDVKNIQDDLLKILASKKSTFNGTITITDTYGKMPTRTIKFTNGSLYSYNDQFSSTYYADSIGNASLSLNCSSLSINGIMIEQ